MQNHKSEPLNPVNLQRDADRLNALQRIADGILFDLMAGQTPTITRHQANRLASAVCGIAGRLDAWAAELGEAEQHLKITRNVSRFRK